MPRQNFSRAFTFVLLTIALIVLVTSAKAGAQETVLYNFDGGTDGCEPDSNLIFDAAGNLYGTFPCGGAYTDGAVFELSPQAGGGWKDTVLHSFNSKGGDGYFPLAGLIFDGAGNLYGTTERGGAHMSGIVFELTPALGGGWDEKILHSFGGGTDGSQPNCTLIMDTAGNLYGTTSLGGTHNEGMAFELTPTGSGGWTEKMLHNFGSSNTDGTQPWAGMIFDAAGNLYGTTFIGGAYRGGTVFELTPHADGGWSERVLHNFGKADSNGVIVDEAFAGVIFDAAGNLYGTTYDGGVYGGGVVYELTPGGDGGWKTAILQSLDRRDGSNPFGGLVLDTAGNLYGTTTYGGHEGICGASGCGTVFELSPSAGGAWSLTVLETFDYTDGGHPTGSLILDSSGNLYGTTSAGGSGVFGTVFEIVR